MTRSTLQAYGRAVGREAPFVAAYPERLLWQQLYNRLQWDEEAARLLEPERERRSRAGADVWLRRESPLEESSALRASLPASLGPIATCAISPDGDFFVFAGGSAADGDYDVKILDARSRDLRHSMSGHPDPVSTCVVSPDSRFVISAGPYHHVGGGCLYVWDPRTGENLKPHVPLKKYANVAISPDGAILAAPGDEFRVRILDTGAWEERWSLFQDRHDPGVCAFHPDGRVLAVGAKRIDDGAGTLTLWKTEPWEVIKTLDCGPGVISSLAFSPDGSRVVSVQPGVTRVLEAETWGELHRFKARPGRLAYSPDGSFVAFCGDAMVEVRDTATWEVRSALVGHEGTIGDCAVSPDATFILTAGGDHTLKIWDAGLALEGQEPPPRSLPARASETRVPAPAPLTEWDIASGASTLRTGTLEQEHSPLAVTPDGSLVLSRDGWVFDPDGSVVSVLKGSPSITAGDISPDGTLVVTADQRTLTVWDARTGQALRTLVGHRGAVNDCDISPDGTFVVSASDDCSLRIWDLTNGDEVHKLLGHLPVSWLGRYSVMGSYYGQVQGVLACDWSPDGSFIVSVGVDGTLRIWDPRRGRQLRIPSVTHVPMRSCAVTPDARYVVSTGDDRALLIHEATGRRVAAIPGPSNVVAHHSEPRFGTVSRRGFEELEAVGLEYGPLIALIGNGGAARCPACRASVAGPEARPGTTACPACGTPVRVADFASFRPRRTLLWPIRAWWRRHRAAAREAKREAKPPDLMERLRDFSGGYAEVEVAKVPWYRRWRRLRGRVAWIPGAQLEVQEGGPRNGGLPRSAIVRRAARVPLMVAVVAVGYLLASSPYGALLALLALYIAASVVPKVARFPGKPRHTLYELVPPLAIAGTTALIHSWLTNWWVAVAIGLPVGGVAGLLLQVLLFKDIAQEGSAPAP